MPWLRTVSIDDPAQRLAALERAPADSRRGAAGAGPRAIEAGQLDAGRRPSATLLGRRPVGVARRVAAGPGRARTPATAAAQCAFNAVYGQVPGELAPKLALALACETGGEPDIAESLYVVCARTDANYIAPAAFGLARIRSGRSDVDGALARARPGPADQPVPSPRRAGAGPACSPGRAAACRRCRPPLDSSTASTSTPSTGRASA